MFFTTLVFGAALTLELFGSYISIMGLSKNASYILVGLAITLDFAKIIIATVLYKQWKNLHGFLKYTLIPPLIFLIIFTSAGAYAFLIQEFSKTTTGQEQTQTRIEALEQEKVKLEARKKEIDGQIAKLPPESVVQRRRMTELFAKEIEHINTRTIEMDKEIPELKIKNMADTTQGGTIGSIAKAYGVSAESITKLLVFPLVLVIDPLAIILLTVANFLVEQRKKDKKEALNNQLEIEALMAVEAKNKPPEPIPAPPIVAPVVAPSIIPDTPPIPIVEPITQTVAPVIIPVEAHVEVQPVIRPVVLAPTPINQPIQAIVETVIEPVMAPVQAPKNNAWMMPFSNPISSWRNKVAPAVVPVPESTIEDVMTELSNLETSEITPVETVIEVKENILEQLSVEKTQTVETPEEPQVTENILNSIEDIYDEAPEYEVVTPVSEVLIEKISSDLASEEEVKMALAELEDNSFQESLDPADIQTPQVDEIVESISELEEAQEPEEDIFAQVDEALEKSKEVKVVETPKRTFIFPRPSASDLTEQINDDIFDNYEISNLEIMQVIGVNEKDKGFDTSKVLEEDLF